MLPKLGFNLLHSPGWAWTYDRDMSCVWLLGLIWFSVRIWDCLKLNCHSSRIHVWFQFTLFQWSSTLGSQWKKRVQKNVIFYPVTSGLQPCFLSPTGQATLFSSSSPDWETPHAGHCSMLVELQGDLQQSVLSYPVALTCQTRVLCLGSKCHTHWASFLASEIF